MTNKLVVIINSLKVPKIKKILLYEMKFLVWNYSCLQNPRLGGYRPPDPRSLCPLSQLNLLNPPPPPNKIPGYATDIQHEAVIVGFLTRHMGALGFFRNERRISQRNGLMSQKTCTFQNTKGMYSCLKWLTRSYWIKLGSGFRRQKKNNNTKWRRVQ